MTVDDVYTTLHELQSANTDDLKFFDKFPWGKICYNHLIEILIGLDMERKFKDRPGRKDDKSPSQYNILGCPWILQVSFDKFA